MGIKNSFFWVVGILALTACVLVLGWEEIKELLWQVNPNTLILLCLLQVGTLALTAYKWHFLLAKIAPGYSFGRVFAVYLGGDFVESVTPAVKLGGEAARVYLFRRLTALPYTQLAGVLLAHKYISLLPFILICIFFLIMSLIRFELPPLFLLSFIALTGLFAVVALLMRKHRITKVENPVTKMDNLLSLKVPLSVWQKKWQAARIFLQGASRQARTLVSFREQFWLVLISLLVWALYPVKVYLVTGMLGLDVEMLTVAIATYTAYMVSMIPLAPGGLGTFEGSMALIFNLSGLSPVSGLAVALLSRLVTYWFSLLLSAVASASLALEGNLLLSGLCRPATCEIQPKQMK